MAEQQAKDSQQKLKALERKAVSKAKATADAAFKPPSSVLNAKKAATLLALVDGPPLDTYEGKESVYVGRSIPVGAGKSLTVPIQVSVPGSVVDYAIEVPHYDIMLAIGAERDEGITMVKESSRVSAADSPLTQKFLVGTLPCLIKFTVSNEYSWVRDKLVSYKITVTPPSGASLLQSRRARATTSLAMVQEDVKKGMPQLASLQTLKLKLEQEVAAMSKELETKKKALQAAALAEQNLLERKTLRLEQERLLKERLQHGWADEKSVKGK